MFTNDIVINFVKFKLLKFILIMVVFTVRNLYQVLIYI